ncbi:hypothetical protein FRB94_003275 [Tulasnella sp. JGI-2019a]|nr:hypothetical protein FRB94_003275 [Tulasnella sp. JGI-2019a]KAG9033017.1 hypothetical protein FRB95_000679 [Tulasnella sp. JGI-2019a]
MEQPFPTRNTSTPKTGPITVQDIREWAREMENGDVIKLMQENIDDNVEWTLSTPANGPLGKTSPTAGVYTSRDQVFEGIMAPHAEHLTDEPIKFELIDCFIQPSGLNDPAERHLTKAVLEIKESAVLKNSGKDWVNYCVHNAFR